MCCEHPLPTQSIHPRPRCTNPCAMPLWPARKQRDHDTTRHEVTGTQTHCQLDGQVLEEPWVLLDLAKGDALRWVGHKDARQQVPALGADLERGGYRILDGQDALPGTDDNSEAGNTCAARSAHT